MLKFSWIISNYLFLDFQDKMDGLGDRVAALASASLGGALPMPRAPGTLGRGGDHSPIWCLDVWKWKMDEHGCVGNDFSRLVYTSSRWKIYTVAGVLFWTFFNHVHDKICPFPPGTGRLSPPCQHGSSPHPSARWAAGASAGSESCVGGPFNGLNPGINRV